MLQSDLKVDGNAIAGLLREIFTMEMTNAESTCAGCGTVHAVGRVDVYLNAPGVVVRWPGVRAGPDAHSPRPRPLLDRPHGHSLPGVQGIGLHRPLRGDGGGAGRKRQGDPNQHLARCPS